jgi:hypothetical protein
MESLVTWTRGQNPAKYEVTVERRDGTAPLCYRCSLSVCPSPVCHCRDLLVDVEPADERTRSDWGELPPVRLSFNPFVEEVELLRLVHGKTSRIPLGDLLARGISPSLNSVLKDFFLCEKDRIVEAANPDKYDSDFEFDEVLDEGQYEFFSDHFPFSRPLLVTYAGRTLAAVEQYCVRPGCTCQGIGLAFGALPAPGERPNKAPECSLHYDFSDRAWTRYRADIAPTAEEQELIRTFQDQNPGWKERLWNHRKMLRRLFAASLKVRERRAAESGGRDLPASSLSPIRRTAPRVGRNDPCPCGSGKKYKKCCGQ